MNILVFEVNVNRYGEDTIYRTFHLIANSFFEAAHVAQEYISENEEMFGSIPIEISSIAKVEGIENIINGDGFSSVGNEEYDGSEPIEVAKDLSDNDVIEFKCACKENIRIPNSNFPYVKCPNCGLKIFRNEIKDAGGIYFYHKSEDHEDDEQ